MHVRSFRIAALVRRLHACVMFAQAAGLLNAFAETDGHVLEHVSMQANGLDDRVGVAMGNLVKACAAALGDPALCWANPIVSLLYHVSSSQGNFGQRGVWCCITASSTHPVLAPIAFPRQLGWARAWAWSWAWAWARVGWGWLGSAAGVDDAQGRRARAECHQLTRCAAVCLAKRKRPRNEPSAQTNKQTIKQARTRANQQAHLRSMGC